MAKGKKTNTVISPAAEEKIEKIINSKPKNERIAFARKLKKMYELVDSLTPIEEKILDIIYNEKNPIMDEIQELRATMVRECVHPKDNLVYFLEKEEGLEYVVCKFCNARLMVQ